MHFSFKLHGSLCFLIGVLVTLSGCDWAFPLASPSHAKVDTRLIGNWLEVGRSDQRVSDRSLIISIAAANKVTESFREKNKIPSGAMILNLVNYLHPNVYDESSYTLWPTKIGDMQVINWISTKDLKNANHKHKYLISKYEVSGDDLTFYDLKDKKGITKSLGDSYSSADLLQEISKAKWSRHSTFKRIR